MQLAKRDLAPRSLRDWRKYHYLTLKELGALVGVKPGTVWNWETGRAEPEYRNVRKLAEALGLPSPHLIVLPERKRPAS